MQLLLFWSAAAGSYGTASGDSIASGIGAEIAAGVTASGDSIASGIGAEIAAGVTASGDSIASGIGAEIAAGVGTASGDSIASGIGAEIAAGVGTASGDSTSGGSTTVFIPADGTAAGDSAASAVSSFITAVAGTANGNSSAFAQSSSIGFANGGSMASAIGKSYLVISFKYRLGDVVFNANGHRRIVMERLFERDIQQYVVIDDANSNAELAQEKLLFPTNRHYLVNKLNRINEKLEQLLT